MYFKMSYIWSVLRAFSGTNIVSFTFGQYCLILSFRGHKIMTNGLRRLLIAVKGFSQIVETKLGHCIRNKKVT